MQKKFVLYISKIMRKKIIKVSKKVSNHKILMAFNK